MLSVWIADTLDCNPLVLALSRTRHSKTNVVVSVRCVVPVAIRTAKAVWFVVPGLAAQHPTTTGSQTVFRAGSNDPPRNR